ncbi:hypothetical protein H6F97_25060 [Microcoleus sp. FACHB-1]|nr:hypothetical protein [Microcoleus sp. FACHB-1]
MQELWQGVVPCCILLSRERWDFPATIALFKQASLLAYTVLPQQDTQASQPNGIEENIKLVFFTILSLANFGRIPRRSKDATNTINDG